jgi:ATP-dependent Clp protease ATP-binding subunit ClpC
VSELPALQVYFTLHHDGHLTGQLLRARQGGLFEDAPPSAYGRTEEEVLRQLAVRVAELSDAGSLDPFLWDAPLETRSLTVDVHPQTMHRRQPVVGKAEVPLRLTYVFGKAPGGAYRVLLPRFGWFFMLENLTIARDVLSRAVSSALLGEHPRWLYDFRREGEERVQAWRPAGLDRDRSAGDGEEPRPPTLDAVAEELVARAARGKLPPLVIDEAALRPWLASVTATTSPPSLLLVGEPGVGKTSWVLQLATLLARARKEKGRERKVPRLWRTSADRILAGMVYLGMWQERCLALAEELAGEGDLLYVDRLTAVVAPQHDGTSIADLLAPAVRAGEVSLVAECTPAELERLERRAPGVVGLFRVVRLPPPPAAAMPALLQRYQAARRTPAALHPAALPALVRNLELFQRDAEFPGRAYRFADWLHRESEGKAPHTIHPRQAAEAFARYTGLPVQIVSDDVPAGREELAAALRRGVIGQDAACAACAGVLARLKAGLNDPEKPVGTLLFAGPTGVGKTELAKQLARTLFGGEERLIRVDMSEYMFPGAAARLSQIGPGVTSLAAQVRSRPLSVVLLDEIEKAHAEVFDLLLGVLGEGRLTDELGRAVDFRMTLVVMTSNLGVAEGGAVGFGAGPGGDHLRAVREAFRPELYNRLDHVLAFRALGEEDLLRIVDLELAKVIRREGFARRRLSLAADREARAWLARHGWDAKLGARPLKRLIEEAVVAPLAVRLAAEPALRDRRVVVAVRGSAAHAALAGGEVGVVVG